MVRNVRKTSATTIYAPCAALQRPSGTIPMCMACEVRDFTFCAALDADEIASVQAIVRQVRLAPGQLLFQEGDEASDLFNVVEGEILLYKMLADGRRQITGFMYPGGFLGVAGAGGYSYSAEALTDATLCRFPRRRLFALFERFPKLEHRLLGIATDELTAAQDQMLLLGRKTASEKIASFLLTLAERSGVPDDADEVAVTVPMTRAHIADYLGLTIETVSRALGRLKRAGLIRVPDVHQVVIARRGDLKKIAEGE